MARLQTVIRRLASVPQAAFPYEYFPTSKLLLYTLVYYQDIVLVSAVSYSFLRKSTKNMTKQLYLPFTKTSVSHGE